MHYYKPVICLAAIFCNRLLINTSWPIRIEIYSETHGRMSRVRPFFFFLLKHVFVSLGIYTHRMKHHRWLLYTKFQYVVFAQSFQLLILHSETLISSSVLRFIIMISALPLFRSCLNVGHRDYLTRLLSWRLKNDTVWLVWCWFGRGKKTNPRFCQFKGKILRNQFPAEQLNR